MIIVILLLLGIYGIFIEPHFMRVRNIQISQKQALKIAHFTDLHFCWHTSIRRFRKFAKNIVKNQPDMILFTGDLFDKVKWAKNKDWTALITMLYELEAPMGKFAIVGNHDFEDDKSDFAQEILEKSGFSILKNNSERVEKISLSGMDDLREGQPDFDIEPETADFSLLLIHEPDTVLKLKNSDKFDLIVAGHSHGGQIRIGNFRLRNEGSKAYDNGRYTLNDKTILYVNSGIGLTFLPIRFGVPPEIVYYEI